MPVNDIAKRLYLETNTITIFSKCSKNDLYFKTYNIMPTDFRFVGFFIK